MLQRMWRTASFLVLGTLAACNAEAKRPESWVRTGPLGPVPARVSDRLPLSDQGSEGDWVPYEPMTDEFDGPALDPNKWWPRNPGWLGRQPAYFWPGNVTVSDGKLHLTMRREEVPEMPKDKGYHTYTSAAVQSKGLVRYGYFEVKARPMRSHGSSSFWFYHSTPEEWTEIDVFEIGGGASGFERKYNMNVHVFRTPTENEHWSSHGVWTAPKDLADDYHVYGLEWGPDKIKWYFDGVLVRWVENTHWHQALTLNFDSETMPEWFGLPEDDDLPSTYSIEYVRSWKRPKAQ
jgi:beta-glucanase (GH16 family)